MGVVEVSSVNWHDAGGDFVETYLDMSGPYAEMYPYHRLQLSVWSSSPIPRWATRSGTTPCTRPPSPWPTTWPRATAGLTPPEREVFELTPCDPALPRVVYIWCVHSPQAMSGSPTAFCTATYGLTQLTPPWICTPTRSSTAR